MIQRYYQRPTRLAPFDIKELWELIAYDKLELTTAILSEKCERCIKIRTPQVPKAIPILKKEFSQFEVLDDNLIRVFCPLASSSIVNSLLVSAGVEVSEIWIAGMEPKAYLSELAGGGVVND